MRLLGDISLEEPREKQVLDFWPLGEAIESSREELQKWGRVLGFLERTSV